MCARATEPIVMASPEFVIEGEVAISVSVRERVILAGTGQETGDKRQ